MFQNKRSSLALQSTVLDIWVVSGKMSPVKDDLAACAVSSLPALIMNGGRRVLDDGVDVTDSELEDSTTFTTDGETFDDSLPRMPYGLYHHCMVSLGGSGIGDLFVTGGEKLDDSAQFGTSASNKSFLYHSETMEWEELPGLPITSRGGFVGSQMCGLAYNSNGEQEVVFIAAYEEIDGVDTSLVEIFNVPSRQWRSGQHKVQQYGLFFKVWYHFISGNPIPKPLESATVVQLDESFLLVGGWYGVLEDVGGGIISELLSVRDTIWKYEPLIDSWTLLETRIPFAAINPIAMMVDIDIFPDCAHDTENGTQ